MTFLSFIAVLCWKTFGIITSSLPLGTVTLFFQWFRTIYFACGFVGKEFGKASTGQFVRLASREAARSRWFTSEVASLLTCPRAAPCGLGFAVTVPFTEADLFLLCKREGNSYALWGAYFSIAAAEFPQQGPSAQWKDSWRQLGQGLGLTFS